MGERFERARLLFGQGRFALAEKELLEDLADDPEDRDALALLALARSNLGRRDDALGAARAAVRAAPDWDWAHYVLASVLYDRDEYAEAEEAVGEAVRLDPEYADYRRLQAAILVESGEPAKGLAAARVGMELDPESARLRAIEGLALHHLNRPEEAAHSFREALALDPENALAHAGLGRVAVRTGDHRGAEDHYREALRANPGYEWARAGLLDALRARYPVYGLLLRFFEWMRSLPSGARTAVFIGIYVLAQVARKTSTSASGATKTMLQAFFVLYGVFALLTWAADPLFNLLLRLRREGRLLLDEDETKASNAVGALLAGAALAGVGWLLWRRDGWWMAALLLALAMPSTTAIFALRKSWVRTGAGIVVAGTLLAGLSGVAMELASGGSVGGTLLCLAAIVVFVLGTWIIFGLGLLRRR
ncbi:MAG: tetratricopeptide repeat protein [Planctomycetes bacterium]|nr:tetratricopeptide repeat protein [Planctomycetota bacterium]